MNEIHATAPPKYCLLVYCTNLEEGIYYGDKFEYRVFEIIHIKTILRAYSHYNFIHHIK